MCGAPAGALVKPLILSGARRNEIAALGAAASGAPAAPHLTRRHSVICYYANLRNFSIGGAAEHSTRSVDSKGVYRASANKCEQGDGGGSVRRRRWLFFVLGLEQP
jgi:hypothetical protein